MSRRRKSDSFAVPDEGHTMEPSERCQAMLAAMDVIEMGVCVTDAHGRVLFENEGLRRQIKADRSERTLDEAMSDVRQAALQRVREEAAGEGRRGVHPAVASAAVPRRIAKVSVQVRTHANQYRVEAIPVAGAVRGLAHVIVMTIRARRPRRLTVEALRSRYGLTTREARVSALLGGGVRTREIAESLGISLHTARRHVESVLRKLGVHSRLDVRQRLNE
jgi:DNA-binding CsgD family transcriptional regulator